MQSVVNLITLASLYCLICCGYVLIYRVSRVLSLAHGELMAMGGYFIFTVAMGLGSHFVASFLIACVLCLALGFAVYFALMRFMTGESVVSGVLVTIALGIFLRGMITLIWTAQTLYPLQQLSMENRPHELPGGGVISTFGIVSVVAAILLYVSLFLYFKFTRWGLRMRAVGEKPLLASQRGIQLHKFYAISWGLAAFSGGLAGMIRACDFGLDPGMVVIGLKAFTVVIVGGLDSLGGVIPGALVVALAELLAINFISPQASEAAPFIVLLIMLLIRPWGLFGTREELKRV